MKDSIHLHGLPDPIREPAFYHGVTFKRLVAWLVDLVPILIIVTLVVTLTLFLTLIIAPFLWLVIGLLYRWLTIARNSATWGMQLMAIELREADGSLLRPETAFLHALGYSLSTLVFPVQVASMILMVALGRGQGLTDLVLGTAMINRPAR
jgi:uncharacterized RDD family membrane protein YckC